jgi:hypothetical protein
MKTHLILFACLALTAPRVLGQDARPLPVSRVATRAAAPLLFAPRGWKIEKQINGDLNRDKKPDAILVLVENKAASMSRQRALVVVLREGKGWRRVGFNNSLLQGTRDGGAFYGASETPLDLSIRKGIMQIDQESGSREVQTWTYKLRYDARQNRIVLIGFDSIIRDRADGSVQIVKANYLRGIQNTKQFKGNIGPVKYRTTLISRKLRRLEEIRGDER